MKLCVFSMIRNERDILGSFLPQLDRLFDRIVIADHESNDGTEEILEEFKQNHDQVELYTVRGRGYPQNVITSFFVNRIQKEEDPDWIFILDADEFLSIQTRKEIEKCLLRLEECDIVNLNWRIAYPGKMTGWESISKCRLLKCEQISSFKKIIIHRSSFEKYGEVRVAMGNHSLDGDFSVVEGTAEGFEIVHLPFRSIHQLRKKIFLGSLAYYGDIEKIKKGWGYHWKKILNNIAIHQQIEFDDFISMVNIYNGEALQGKKLQYDEFSGFDSLECWDFPCIIDDYSIAREIYLDLEKMLLSLEDSGEVIIENSGGGTIVMNDSPPCRHADAVEEISSYDSGMSAYESRIFDPVVDIESALFQMLDYSVSKRESGHHFFLSHMIQLLAPRRYVELGQPLNGSFLSICDTIKKCDFPCEAFWVTGVARDLKTAQENVGGFELDMEPFVFSRTLNCPNHQARKRFPIGSVDLLVIRECSSYESAQKDFQTWFSSLTNRGVVVFQAGKAFDGDSGVLSFLKSLKKRYPSMEFIHGSGLAILLLGKEIPAEFLTFFKKFRTDGFFRKTYVRWCEKIALLQPLIKDCGEIKNKIKELDGLKKVNREIVIKNEDLGSQNEVLNEQLRTLTLAYQKMESEYLAVKEEHQKLLNSRTWMAGTVIRKIVKGEVISSVFKKIRKNFRSDH